MQVTIFHNITRDGLGRPLGIIDGFQPEHDVVRVFSYETALTEPVAAAEEAFHLFNVGEDPDFGVPSPIALAYRAKGLRSLSVGDLVRVGVSTFACASYGWDAVATPTTALAG